MSTAELSRGGKLSFMSSRPHPVLGLCFCASFIAKDGRCRSNLSQVWTDFCSWTQACLQSQHCMLNLYHSLKCLSTRSLKIDGGIKPFNWLYAVILSIEWTHFISSSSMVFILTAIRCKCQENSIHCNTVLQKNQIQTTISTCSASFQKISNRNYILNSSINKWL